MWDACSLPCQPPSTQWYTWLEKDTVRVKNPAQEHNTISPSRVRTWSALSRGKWPNWPPCLHYMSWQKNRLPLPPPQTRWGLELNSRRFARGGALKAYSKFSLVTNNHEWPSKTSWVNPCHLKNWKPFELDVFIVGITMYCSQYDLTTTRVPVDILLCICKVVPLKEVVVSISY